MFGISKARKKLLKNKPEIVNKEISKETEKKKEVSVTTFTKAYLEWNPETRRMMIVLVATNGKKVKKVYENADSPLLRDINDIFSKE